jgi:hypothetical protein
MKNIQKNKTNQSIKTQSSEIKGKEEEREKKEYEETQKNKHPETLKSHECEIK